MRFWTEQYFDIEKNTWTTTHFCFVYFAGSEKQNSSRNLAKGHQVQQAKEALNFNGFNEFQPIMQHGARKHSPTGVQYSFWFKKHTNNNHNMKWVHNLSKLLKEASSCTEYDLIFHFRLISTPGTLTKTKLLQKSTNRPNKNSSRSDVDHQVLGMGLNNIGPRTFREFLRSGKRR